MQISIPHKDPVELQKTRDRLSGNAPPTAALAAAKGKETSPFMTPEQTAVAQANLKARMDARRAAATQSAHPAGITTATGVKRGTKVLVKDMQVSSPGLAPGSGPSPSVAHDLLNPQPTSAATTTAIEGGIASVDQAHNVATMAAFNPQRHQTTGPRVFPAGLEQQGAPTGKVVGTRKVDALLE